MKSLQIDFDHEGRSYRGFSIEALRRNGLPDAVILVPLKGVLSQKIDADAERARAPWITPGVGQSMEYDKVEQQADAALKASGSATAAKYPMLAATIGIDIDPDTGKAATDVLGVARRVQAARDAWTEKGAQIRRTRLTIKAAIAEADTIEAAIEAADNASWPTAPGA